MKKYLLLVIMISGTAQACLAGDIDFKKPLIEGEAWQWLNLGMVLLIGGMILFLYIARRLFEMRKRHEDRNKPVAKALRKDNIYEPRFWYQCKNCRLTVRKDSPPNTAECFQAVDHLWTELAEVGTKKYLCKKCNTLIKARTEPVTVNCPDAPEHQWELLQ